VGRNGIVVSAYTSWAHERSTFNSFGIAASKREHCPILYCEHTVDVIPSGSDIHSPKDGAA